MKTVIVMLVVLFTFLNVKAQYKFAFGASVSTPAKVTFDKTPNTDSLVYEVSFKAITAKYLFVDLSGSFAKDYTSLTILSEYHIPVFYPLDFYLGLGAHIGAYKASHWTDNAVHKKMIAGLDGVAGLQVTIRPIAISLSTKPVYNLYPDDAFFWLKQIGARICF